MPPNLSTASSPAVVGTAAQIASGSHSDLQRVVIGPCSGLSLAQWCQQPGEIHLSPDQVAENILVCRLAGSARVKKLHRRAVVGDGARLHSITTVPARSQTSWVIGAPVVVAHLYIDDATLLRAMPDGGDRAGSSRSRLAEIFARPDPFLARLLDALLLATNEPATDSSAPLQDAFILDQLAATLVCHVAERYMTDADGANLMHRRGRVSHALAPSKLRQLEEFVSTHLGDAITLDDLAAIARLERHHFMRAFKATTGSSPYAWLRDLRVRAAGDLLRHTRQSLGEVALACGFSSASHLCHAYRRAFGTTPASSRVG